MKTGIRTTAILTALLAGTMIAGAQLYRQRQQQGRQGPQQLQGRQGPQQFQGRQGPQQFQGRRQSCPLCGNPQFHPQGQGQRQQSGSFGPQSRQDGPQQQFREPQGQHGSNPWLQEKMNLKQRQAILKQFDTDKDGQLSNEERQAVREAHEKRQRGKPGKASKRPGPPPGEE
jgi:hypothetical protein